MSTKARFENNIKHTKQSRHKFPSVVKEVGEYIEDHKEDIKGLDVVDAHQQLFNEDYYLIGYYNCEQWLKKHNISVFHAIKYCQDYENENFGECRQYEDAEKVVNMLTYIVGENILFNSEKN